jgi:hypothetical protein
MEAATILGDGQEGDMFATIAIIASDLDSSITNRAVVAGNDCRSSTAAITILDIGYKDGHERCSAAVSATNNIFIILSAIAKVG